MVLRRPFRIVGLSTWWQCGSPEAYHDMSSFDLDTEKCTSCGMDVEEYWTGYEQEVGDTQEHLGGAYRIRRAAIGSRPVTAVYVEEGPDDSSPQRPERCYLQLGVGE